MAMEKGDIEKVEDLPPYPESPDGGAHKEAAASFVHPTPEEEARIIRKLDSRLLPLVFVLYSLSVLDRSNLGNAKLAGMTKDIDLGGNHYDLLGTIFYIAYILFQWLNIGWKQFKPHHWAAAVVLIWGFIASIQAAVTSWGGLMTCRFFLVSVTDRWAL